MARSVTARARATTRAWKVLYANCEVSTAAPFMNVADFMCFLNKFAAGCS